MAREFGTNGKATDWTHNKPTDNFCEKCGHGLGSERKCHWCGHVNNDIEDDGFVTVHPKIGDLKP